MKSLIYSLLLLLLTSCSYRTLEGRARPVYFSADTAVFNDTFSLGRMVTYESVMGLSSPCLTIVDLRQGEEVKELISKPTIFTKENVPFLVYPGEHIFIAADDTISFIPTFSTVHKKKPVRDRELLVLKTFQQLEKRPDWRKVYLENNYYIDYTYQTILDFVKAQKDQIAPAERASQRLFDSLCTVYQVSRKFKKLTKDYIHNRYNGHELGLYIEYRDTLLAHQVFRDKIQALLPEVNGLTKTSQLNSNLKDYTNGLYNWLFNNKRGISNMVYAGSFQACFDSVVTNFRGPARDHLLSRIMFHACESGVSIPESYQKQYRHYSMNRDYRKIIARAARQSRRFNENTPAVPNELLRVDGKTKVRLEEVLAQYKGKYIFLDLWASWCVPCMEEMPASQALKKKYPADKIVFLNLSVDKSVPIWRSRLSQFNSDSLTNFMLLDAGNAALVREIGMSTIPRYLLFDREGKILDNDAPRPSDPQLKKLLDKLLLD